MQPAERFRRRSLQEMSYNHPCMQPPPVVAPIVSVPLAIGAVGDVLGTGGGAGMHSPLPFAQGTAPTRRYSVCHGANYNHFQRKISYPSYPTSSNVVGSSTVAIDNKIEQAMDLVKSHLMFAVREEVDVLKEQITELIERNSQLEYENSILRATASQDTLNKLAQPRQPPASSS